jgi:hypothetical protein
MSTSIYILQPLVIHSIDNTSTYDDSEELVVKPSINRNVDNGEVSYTLTDGGDTFEFSSDEDRVLVTTSYLFFIYNSENDGVQTSAASCFYKKGEGVTVGGHMEYGLGEHSITHSGLSFTTLAGDTSFEAGTETNGWVKIESFNADHASSFNNEEEFKKLLPYLLRVDNADAKLYFKGLEMLLDSPDGIVFPDNIGDVTLNDDGVPITAMFDVYNEPEPEPEPDYLGNALTALTVTTAVAALTLGVYLAHVNL